MGEIIFSILCAGGLLIPATIFKQWWLFTVFIVFFICFGLIEWIAVSKSGLSVSQHFWQFSLQNKTGAIIILVCMLISWLSLIWHFGYKMWNN